jgi:hypothetical protein
MNPYEAPQTIPPARPSNIPSVAIFGASTAVWAFFACLMWAQYHAVVIVGLALGGLGVFAVSTSDPSKSTATPVTPQVTEIELPTEGGNSRTTGETVSFTPVEGGTETLQLPNAATPAPAETFPEPKVAPMENPRRRQWASADGKFATDAEFLSMTGGSVKLRKPDGAEITVPIDRLSDMDRQWIEAYRRSK